ncbi:MAG: prolipoprotein diacylglyceryl transferase [Dongiaceae bacterium]
MFVIPFPNIDPTLIEIGPLVIRWYALAYIVGLLMGWRYCLWIAKQPPQTIKPDELDDFVFWAMVGVLLGGRLGYVLFYGGAGYLANPLEILKVWQGGMSFHGGLIGIMAAMFLFARRRKLPFLALADLVAAAGPIGLFLGRLANFVNAELWGRPTAVPWAMVFPTDPQGLPRHPSQLYEAGLEGILLFVVLFILARREAVRRCPGILGGVFLGGYGLARIFVEFFREPDNGRYLQGDTTEGQWLSVPMVLIGAYLIWRACRAPAKAT